MRRSPWPIAAGGTLLVVAAALLLTDGRAGGDRAACLGLIPIWLYTVLAGAWYEGMVVRRVPYEGDPSTWPAEAWEAERRWYWPGLILVMFLPGLWIGAVAHSPLLIAALYLLAGRVIAWLTEVLARTTHVPPDPKRGHLDLEEFLQKMGILALGVVMGISLRLILSG